MSSPVLTSRERYVVTLEALPCAVPASQRMKRALKVLLRSFGLSCVSITSEDEVAELRRAVAELTARLAKQLQAKVPS